MFSIIVPENTEPPARRSHKKSRAGCRKCKERKLKCDEVHPICGNCERRYPTLQSCDYTRPPQTDTKRPLLSASESKKSLSTSPRSESDSDWRLLLPSSVNAELLDPFVTFPPTQVKGGDILMKFYLKTAVYKGFPWQPASATNPTTTFYVPLVMSDVVLFHATLQLSAWRLDYRALKGVGLSINFLAAECIRLLKDRVENESSGVAVSDQTISAVATLAAIEHERGNTKILRMHLEGLKRMVSIRGGLNSIRETNPMVANSVFWAFAVALYEVPYPNLDTTLPAFFPIEHNLALVPQSIFQDFESINVDPAPFNLVQLGVDPSLATVVSSIQHVSQLIPTNTAYSTATASLTILTRMCTLLSHLLSILSPRSGPQSETSDELIESHLISQATRCATLIHVFSPWRGLPPDGSLTISHILHQLIATLKTLLTSTTLISNTLVLWVLSVAGVSAAKMAERTWFVSHLAEMAEEMQINDWEEMKSHIRQVIWHERLCEKVHRELWEEVSLKKKEFSEG